MTRKKSSRSLVIRVSADTHAALAKAARGFETPNNTIRRLLGLPSEGHKQAGPACPQCGENDIDSLVWIDDRRVRCANCEHVFQPH